MKKDIRPRARAAGILVAAALLIGCYAPLANQQGYLNLNLARATGPAVADPEIIVLVVDSGYQAALAETLYLISKAKNSNNSLSTSDQNRLTTLGEQLATNGLVKFGGYPFFRAYINGTSGSFTIPGIPAGRQYFMKIFEFSPGFTFDVKNIDQNFGNLIQLDNLVFSTESYLTPWQNWTPISGQPVTVSSNKTTTINVTLGTPAF